MPYIQQEFPEEQRQILNPHIERLKYELSSNFDEDTIEGAMNYSVTSLLEAIPSASDSEWRYKYINRVLGVLQAIQFEFYRRLGAPYEDRAIAKNGDVPMYEEMNG